MPAQILADRLAQARRKRFVGRTSELALFRAALDAQVPDFAVLYCYGPGGVGKSALLRECIHLTVEAGRPYLLLDGRHLDASPQGFWAGLQVALKLPPDQSPLEVLGTLVNFILFVDTYELLAPLDNWLREEFLPQLPENVLVVLAGRNQPSAMWRSDDGWGALTRIISLRNLLPKESEAFLLGQGLSRQACSRVLSVTYGHPLALSLAADLFGQSDASHNFDLKKDPDMVRILLERFVADVPSSLMRQALEVCAHAFNTDEDLLSHCLGEEHGYAAFQWLRGLSFIEQGPFGLFPHDLARDVLETELRWRNLRRFRELRLQVRDYVIQQVRQSEGLAQQYAVFALLFLHRNNPFMSPFYEWQSLGQFYIDTAQPADLPAIEQIISRHQGEASLAVLRYWATHPASTIYTFRGAGHVIAGFTHVITLQAITEEDREADPSMRAAEAHLRSTAPLLPGETVLYFRNWMDTTLYQQSPSIFNMAAMVSLRLFFNVPNLAYSFVAHTDPDYSRMFEYLRMPAAPRAGFVLDDQQFDVFVHDWRAESVTTWLRVMGERELLDEIVELETLPQKPQPLVLSAPEFGEAVRQALKDLPRPDLLANNPLLRSRCLMERSDPPPTPALLQALLHEGAEILANNPRTRKLHRALWHTYFAPAPTQEVVAEMLDLPFSTYRYQLGKAVTQLTNWLWQQELYGAEKTTRSRK